MKVIEGEPGPAQAYVLSGDGPRDIRVFKAIAEHHYDHDKQLRCPQTPIRRRHRTGWGLSGVITALALCLRTTVKRYIILLDREHANAMQDFEKKLREHGFEILDKRELADTAWYFKASSGGREAEIYVALLGFEKRIEENLAALIRLKYGNHVQPNKTAINRWLREHRLNDAELIRKATKRELEQAFPSLTRILRELTKTQNNP